MSKQRVSFLTNAGKGLAVILSTFLLVACAQEPTVQSGPDAEKIGDNLYRVDNASMKAAFVDPDADFSRYHKIILAPLLLDDVTIVQPSRSASNRKLWELTEKDKETLAARYQAMMEKYLQEVKPGSEGYQIVTEPGEDVLFVAAAVLAIAPTAAKDDFKSRPAGRSRVFTDGAGSMTIGFVIKDSATGKELASAVDQRRGWGTFRSNNRVTNMSDVNLIFGNWANKLRHSLDNLSSANQ
jgi:hypothetical protein